MHLFRMDSAFGTLVRLVIITIGIKFDVFLCSSSAVNIPFW